MPLNALIGGIVGGSIVEHFGRKTTIMATGPPYILCKFKLTQFMSLNFKNNLNLLSLFSLVIDHIRYKFAHGLRWTFNSGILRGSYYLDAAYLLG